MAVASVGAQRLAVDAARIDGKRRDVLRREAVWNFRVSKRERKVEQTGWTIATAAFAVA